MYFTGVVILLTMIVLRPYDAYINRFCKYWWFFHMIGRYSIFIPDFRRYHINAIMNMDIDQGI